MKTKIIILSLFLALTSPMFAQDMLNKYLETAAKNNPGLKAKFNAYNASLQKIPQVGTLPDPTLAFGYFILPVETKNGPQHLKVSFSQMFPWFGTLASRENVLASVAKAKYELFEDAKSKLFFDVKSTYFALYYIQKQMDITLENIKILDKFKRLALIKIQSGTASSVDAMRVELEINDLENSLLLLKDKWLLNTVKFNNLLNIDNNSNIRIPKTLWETDLKYAKQTVMDSLSNNNHQVKSLVLLKESFAHKEYLAKKQAMPNILLGADYTSIGKSGSSPNAGQDALMFKVGISLPLYRKKYKAMVNETVFLQEVAQNKKQDKINVLETLSEKAYTEYSDAQRRINLYKKQSKLAKRMSKLLENEYANSGKKFEEVLRIERKTLNYAIALEKAKADKQASIAFINYLMGF